MLLGCIADDFTGVSDLANTLARGGMATALHSGVPRGGAAPGCDAGVLALKTRSTPPREAVARSHDALAWLRAPGCGPVSFKVCSTFDSTPEGNIGPVAEALLDALGAPLAVVCPAFPGQGARSTRATSSCGTGCSASPAWNATRTADDRHRHPTLARPAGARRCRPRGAGVRAARARCAAHGIALLGVNTSRGRPGEFGLGALPGREAEFQAAVDAAVAWRIEAGGQSVHCMAGVVGDADRADARRTFVANLREAARNAEPHGLTLLLEPIDPRRARLRGLGRRRIQAARRHRRGARLVRGSARRGLTPPRAARFSIRAG